MKVYIYNIYKILFTIYIYILGGRGPASPVIARNVHLMIYLGICINMFI